MISVIMPYWNRLQATRASLNAMAEYYADMDLEIVVVDDGSPEAFSVDREYPWPVKVIRLPAKTEAKNPCWPINIGVKESSGDTIVLTNPEILHTSPVFQEMSRCLDDDGVNAYVMAATWCPEENKWHCHSTAELQTLHGVKHPKGAGLHFCTMLRRSLWNKVGGFDHEYRDGAGYDDNDFVMRLAKAGAEFIMRDDLVVIHPKTGAKTKWPDGAFQRNAELFARKWTRPVTFCCVQVGNYEGRGAEYVNKLYDMVRRNLTDGYPGRFVCVTDDEEGMDEGIEVIPAPEGVSGWWVKLFLFKRGLFADGEQVVFMDLDTVIVGNLDEIAGYSGKFATLRDFYHPQQVGPAIIAWTAGEYTATIWDEWVSCGKPTTGHGDLWWINQLDQGHFAHNCDKLQDLFPGSFVSYKVHCGKYPPKGAKVVCFHGQPRPHDAPDAWVQDTWKIGGATAAELIIVANTALEQVAHNVSHSGQLDVTWLDLSEPRAESVCIVGGGPSLRDELQELSVRSKSGQKIYALNGCAKFLHDNGIHVDAQVLLDSRPENVSFVQQLCADEYYVASQCDKEIFDAIPHEKITLFHANTENVLAAIPQSSKPLHLISGGSTVGLNAIAIAYAEGFRHIHLFGFDSSYTDTHHAYEQRGNDADAVVDVSVKGKRFRAAPWMVAQVNQFQELALQLADAGCVITVHGDGLLPYVAAQMMETDSHKEAA